MKKQRVKYLIAFIILFFIELMIAIYVHDTIIRPYVGDILVVILLYCMVNVIIPDKIRLMPLWIFIFSAFIEFMQYFKLLKILGLENNTLLRIVLGSTFDWKDIACYGIGCILLGLYSEKKRSDS
jgi:hypothetical protein